MWKTTYYPNDHILPIKETRILNNLNPRIRHLSCIQYIIHLDNFFLRPPPLCEYNPKLWRFTLTVMKWSKKYFSLFLYPLAKGPPPLFPLPALAIFIMYTLLVHAKITFFEVGITINVFPRLPASCSVLDIRVPPDHYALNLKVVDDLKMHVVSICVDR